MNNANGTITRSYRREMGKESRLAAARMIVARQSGWEGSDNQDGHFGGRGDVMIVAARR
jgi:hypothetical protein